MSKIFKSRTMLAGLNAKTRKGDDEYVTAIMYLAPHRNSGAGNVCPMAEKAGCVAACLYKAGRGIMSNVQAARVAKTEWFFNDRAGFMAQLVEDLGRFAKWCERHGVKPAVRLNGTSDIAWENIAVDVVRTVTHGTGKSERVVRFSNVMTAFPEIQFYDYTKVYKRAHAPLPSNYTLVLSYSEADPIYASKVRSASHGTGTNMAVVFRSKERAAQAIAEGWHGMVTVDGDQTDLRFTDPKGVVVALYAKGPAKHDQTGFVID